MSFAAGIMSDLAPRVAIACSGLGFIRRGIEAWAADTAKALGRAGVDATLYGSAGPPPLEPVRSFRRTAPITRQIARVFHQLGGWRYGLGSAYEVEQTSFALALLPRIRHGTDIVHVQDPTIAEVLELAWRRGLSRARVILANGTDEEPRRLKRYSYLQLLTPPAAATWAPLRPPRQQVFVVPNFLDTDAFAPGDKSRARTELGLPAQGTIVLCIAAVKRHHKRIDTLLRTFAAQSADDAMLIVVGGREYETDEMIALGRELLGDRVRFLIDHPRAAMPELYRAADLFVLASLHETFGIVLLEAMASGLAVLCHDTPEFRYVIGPGGACRDLSTDAGFAAALGEMMRPEVRAPLAAAARPHVVAAFSERVVIDRMLTMYRAVAGDGRAAG